MLSVAFGRNQFITLNCDAPQLIDPNACIGAFPVRRSLRRIGPMRPITPFSETDLNL